MLYKKRSKPLKLVGLESLIERLQTNHYQYTRIEEDLRRMKAGYAGEMNFDKHINEFRPSFPIAILHDICLQQNGVYFQMDSIMILPDRILLFEIKNLAGTLKVKSDPTQFIQENNGERKIISNPVTELDRKKIFLSRWLNDRGISTSIEGIVGLAFTNELYIEKELEILLAFTQEIPIKLYEIAIGDSQFSYSDIKRIANEMINAHHEYNPFPMAERMGVQVQDIKVGVLCVNCNNQQMKWRQKKWRCDICLHSSSDKHLDLLNDWFCLIANTITNRQFRYFSTVIDRSVAKRMLQNAGLKMVGRTRNSSYKK